MVYEYLWYVCLTGFDGKCNGKSLLVPNAGVDPVDEEGVAV